MRDREFRVWDGQQMHYTEEFVTKGLVFGYGNPIMNAWGEGGEHLYNISVLDVMDKLPFKDKDEAVIYEGDILSGFNGELKGQIIWEDEDVAFIYKSFDGGGALLNETYLLNFQVIGNIHQNPELCTSL